MIALPVLIQIVLGKDERKNILKIEKSIKGSITLNIRKKY